MAEPEAEDVVVTARGLVQRGEYAAAETVIAEALRGVEPDARQADALYVLAVAQRYGRKLDRARRTLATLMHVDPGRARAYQELGHVSLSENRPNAACSAFEQAVQRNPALAASWRALADLYTALGMTEQAARAAEEASYLDELAEPLAGALSFLFDGKLEKADQLCRHFLRGHRHHVEGLRVLAAIGERMGVLLDAEFLLETALELEPGNLRVRYDYANLELKMQKFEKAVEQTRVLITADADNLRFLSLHGSATAGVGDYEAAIAHYDQVITGRDGQFVLQVMRGHAEKTIGRLDAAVRSYQRAYEIAPLHGDAFWSLANTKTYVFTEQEIAHMRRAIESAEISDDDHLHMCFALGKALEDRAEYEESFVCYERGNSAKQAAVAHRPEGVARRVAAQRNVFTSELFERKAGVGCRAPDAIFIVGLPRSGSTLLEQILASHSMVDGTLELPNLTALTERLRRAAPVAAQPDDVPRYPGILTSLEDDYFRRFGEQFLADTRVYRRGAPMFIDKNPNNFFHVGLIRLILPNAKIIDARRHPMACCFSGFKQLFGQGQEFSYGLAEIGDYYRNYVELMRHWDEVLPGFVLRVQHEDVIEDLETQVRKLLDFCGLPFERDCLNFHTTERSVRTPSSEQVRQPIYRDGMDAWRHYEAWLEPLRQALGPELRETYGID